MIEMARGSWVLSKRTLIIAACVAVLLGGGAFAWSVFGPKDPKAADHATANKVIDEVKNLYLVPDESPTVSLVQDRSKLQDQPFFDKAETGDYLLVYTQAKIAIIYREKVNKLVNAGPISLADNPSGHSAGASTQKP